MSAEGVSAILVSYGRDLQAAGAAQDGESFTGRPEADDLLRQDPNALLLGILFTQGVPAERAWAGPWELRERLGHLARARLASAPEAERDAFQQPP
ncbi:MAG: hypothetical protein Q8K89_10615, partial [Actinomycetota bacterium]|nr:hypothetical protein [Actinomycetota bacterium]